MSRKTSIRQNRQKAEFGDFQTPTTLAKSVCSVLASLGVAPKSIIEPNCGTGTLLNAALTQFKAAETAVGIDINSRYVEVARRTLEKHNGDRHITVLQGDFFRTDFGTILERFPEPSLVLGNPPWVTNATLGVVSSANLPEKSNFQRHKGLDAITGKSNFDISEWMLIRLLESLVSRRATLAMLCKTAVARRVLKHAWKHGFAIQDAQLRRIDSIRYFGASVDACLFVCHCTHAAKAERIAECLVFDSLDAGAPSSSFGLRDERIISDMALFDQMRHLAARGSIPGGRWPSAMRCAA